MNLLARMKREPALCCLFISHDLGVVRRLCDDVTVMHLGQTVERASREDLFDNPKRPYTQALLAAAPSLAQRKSKGYARPLKLSGDPPSPVNPPKDCTLAQQRCPMAQEICRQEQPVL